MVRALLSAVPRWLWLLLAGALLIGAILLYGSIKASSGYSAGYTAKTDEVKQETSRKNDENRKKEQSLNEQISRLQRDNQQLQSQNAIDKRNADQRVNAFGVQLEKTRAILANAATSADASISPAGKTALEAARMLADVLGQSVERNRILAAYADDARVAGELCEQQYDQVRNTLNDQR